MNVSTYSAIPELTPKTKVFALLGALLGLFLAALDQTIVATIGPTIQHQLGIAPALYVWITTAYLLASTVTVPIYGKLSDLYGRKPILVVGIALFLVGSLLAGLAQSTPMLIAFRTVQGLGASSLFVSAFAVVGDLFPPSERGRYTGLVGAVFGLASVAGPLLGGFLSDGVGWRWAFWINLPIGALALLLVIFRMPRLRPTTAQPRLDLVGALWLLVFSVPLLLALSFGRGSLTPGEFGYIWGSWPILSLFGLSALGLVAFWLTEQRVKEPILEPALFGNRTFALGNTLSLVLGAAFLGPLTFLPLFLVTVVGLSSTNTGLTLMPLILGVVVGNIASGQLVTRFGRYKPLMLLGLIVLTLAFMVMGFTLTPSSGQVEITLKMILVGLGLGPAIPLTTLAIQNALPPTQTGVASSSALFFRAMGSTLGIAMMGTLFASTLQTQLEGRIAAATAGLPSALVAQFSEQKRADSGLGFNVTEIKAEITRRFEQDNTSGTSTNVKEQALEAVDQIGQAFREALTLATSQIYRLGILIAALGLLITAFLPELPLRKTLANAEPDEGKSLVSKAHWHRHYP